MTEIPEGGSHRPDGKNQLTMLMADKWYKCDIRSDVLAKGNAGDVVTRLDV